MAGEESIPEWVKWLNEQMDMGLRSLGDRIDKLVTRDAFEQEQKRVDEKFGGQGREIGDLRAKLEAEATARAASELASANKQAQEAQRREGVQRQTNWQWFALFASPVVGALIVWVLNGGLGQ